MRNDKQTLMSAIEQLYSHCKSNPGCFTRSDLHDLETLKHYTCRLIDVASRGQLNDERHWQSFDRAHALLRKLEKKQDAYDRKQQWWQEYLRREEEKFNPYHKPAGSPEGGQFDSAPGGGSGEGSGTGSPRSPSGDGTGRPSDRSPLHTPAADKHPAAKKPQPYVPHDKNPPIPKYKDQFVKKDDWERFNGHVNNPKEIPHTGPVEKYAARQVFAAEGGMAKPKDPKVTAVAGINKPYLDQLRADAATKPEARSLLSRIGRDISPATMTPEDAAEIYKYDFNRRFRGVGGSSALERVGNPYAAATMTDTAFRHGDKDGAKILREAIVKTDPKMDKVISKDPDYIGPEIFSAYSKLAKNPATVGKLLDNVAERRKKKEPNEKDRFDHFKFEKELEGPGI